MSFQVGKVRHRAWPAPPQVSSTTLQGVETGQVSGVSYVPCHQATWLRWLPGAERRWLTLLSGSYSPSLCTCMCVFVCVLMYVYTRVWTMLLISQENETSLQHPESGFLPLSLHPDSHSSDWCQVPGEAVTRGRANDKTDIKTLWYLVLA